MHGFRRFLYGIFRWLLKAIGFLFLLLVILMLVACGIQQAYTVLLQCIEPGFPGAKHGNRVSNHCQSRAKKACKRPCTDNKDVAHI